MKLKPILQKREYMKPSVKVFELRKSPQLLVGSGLNDPTDYPNGGDPLSF